MSYLDSLQLRIDRQHLPPVAQHFVHGLTDHQGYVTPTGWGTLAGITSGLLCLILYRASRVLSPCLFTAYSKLSLADRRDWDVRYSSNIHAASCMYFAYELLYKSDNFWKESHVPLMLRTSNATYLALGISLGYFIVDFVLSARYNLGGLPMMLHHMAAVAAVATAMISGDCHMHAVWLLLTELTTPLINNRWWLDKMGMKAHKLYVVNGLAILFSWLFARILVFLPLFWVFLKSRDQVALTTYPSRFIMLTVPVSLACLNVYWFMKIVKGAIKVLGGAQAKKE